MKWVKAEHLAKITEANTIKFIWKNIICRFDISQSMVSNNDKQFDNGKIHSLCDEMGIRKDFSTHITPKHMQAVNKTIKHTMKRKIDASKGAWVNEFSHVL